MVDHRAAVTLAGLVLGAFALRLSGLDAQSTWYDEAMSLRYATAPWTAIPVLAAADVHPPLHFLVLKAWVEVAGLGDWVVRLPGVLLGTLAVPLLAQLGRRLACGLGGASPRFGTTLGILAAALLAISPLAVWYSQEARMYQQALVLGLVAALCLVGALLASRDGGRTWPWWAGFVLAGLAGLFTHYAGALLLLGLGAGALAWGLVLLGRSPAAGRRMVAGLAAATALVAVGFLPWLPIALDRFGNDISYFDTPPAPLAIVTGTLVAFGGVWPSDGLAAETRWLLLGAVLLLAGAGLAGSLLLPQAGRSPWPFLLPLLWLAVPLLAWVLITADRPKVAERYLLVLLPAWLLLLGLGLATLLTVAATARAPLPRLAGYVAALGAMVLLGLQAAAGLEAARDGTVVRRPDIRGIAATIRAQAQPGDVVVAVGGHGQVALQRYLWQDQGEEGRLAITGIPDITVFDLRAQVTGEEALARLRELDAVHGRLWLVLWQRELGDPAGSVLELLQGQRPRLDVPGRYAGADVLLFQLGGPAPLQPETVGAVPVEAILGGADRPVTLEAWRAEPAPWVAGQGRTVSVFWRPSVTPDVNLTGFVQVLTDDDRIIAQADQPAGGDVYQSRRWQPGSLVTDRYQLALPAETPPGTYRVIAGLYGPDGVRLGVRQGPEGSGRDFVLLGRVTVLR